MTLFPSLAALSLSNNELCGLDILGRGTYTLSLIHI